MEVRIKEMRGREKQISRRIILDSPGNGWRFSKEFQC
jgi:hypothetical protein